MILRLLKTNHAYHFILIPVIVLGLWFRSYIHPEIFSFFEGENEMFLFKPIGYLLSHSALASNLLTLVFVILLSFYILHLNTVYAFIHVRTFLPSNIFILIISGLLTLHTLHPVYFGLFFLMLSIDRIFQAYEKKKFHNNSFESGLFIGIGSLFYFNLIFFFPVSCIGFFVIKKSTEWRNFVLPVLGIITPWLFTWSYYYSTGQSSTFVNTIYANISTENCFLRGNIQMQIYSGFLVLLTLLGSIFFLNQYDKKKISTRKFFQIFFLLFIISFITLLAVPPVSMDILVIMSLPLSFLISNYLIYMKRKFWANLFMYLFIALIIYLQIV